MDYNSSFEGNEIDELLNKIKTLDLSANALIRLSVEQKLQDEITDKVFQENLDNIFKSYSCKAPHLEGVRLLDNLRTNNNIYEAFVEVSCTCALTSGDDTYECYRIDLADYTIGMTTLDWWNEELHFTLKLHAYQNSKLTNGWWLGVSGSEKYKIVKNY